MTIEIRKAKPEDAEAILGISSQIWDGTDYVPKVLDKWIRGDEGTLWCALFQEKVLGFARSTYLSGARCWLEGIRVSPQARGLGLGKALATHQLKDAMDKDFKSCGLSSYIENYESLHIVRSNGFKEIAQFKIYDWFKENEEPAGETAENQSAHSEKGYKGTRNIRLKDCKVRPITEEEADWVVEAMASSETLKQRQNYLSYDWTFEVFSPEWVVKCIKDGDFYSIETPKGSGFFSLSGKHVKGNLKTLNYVSDCNLQVEILAYCIEQALELGFESFCYMAYNNENDEQFKGIGLETYNEHSQDVFVFEKKGRD